MKQKGGVPLPDGLIRFRIRTHILTEKDDPVKVVQRYVLPIARPGDVVTISESALAITQGRAILPSTVKPSLLARFLCRFPNPEGSLATPEAMQLAIKEAGPTRILLACAVAALGKLIGRRGDFFRVAGHGLALIDDIAGTMPPFDRHIVLGPRDSQDVVNRIKAQTGIDAMVVDINDKGCVDILACSLDYPPELMRWLQNQLRDNPLGNDDQQTPIMLLRFVTQGK
ncbi:MAG TPA: F420-0:Gamma-glutamyl ligase [Firmicutes bacterium]|nr:F420-0:Gamma-glutamyl ligase [Bacillota bacterium]